MKTVRIRNMVLGEGTPKICVPIVGRSPEEIAVSAREATLYQPDIVEWRADFYKNLQNEKQVLAVLKNLRAILSDTPLLFTIRTKAEGGEQALEKEQYCESNRIAITSGCVDAIDVELFQGEDTVKLLVEKAHAANVRVIGSNHDFTATPPADEIVKRLCRMQELGVDAAKMAVMPNSAKDVLKLLAATEEMKEQHTESPVITMAMGAKGMISRLAGEVFGSALTFGMVGEASAPGQIPARELRGVLETVHRYS